MSMIETAAAPWVGMYQDRAVSRWVPDAAVDGALPSGLRGAHYRVGPTAGLSYGVPLGNAFADADGYVARYSFTDAGVSFRGEPVKTGAYLRERAAGRPLASSFSTVLPGWVPVRMWRGARGVLSYFPGLGGGDKQPPVKDAPNHVPCVIGDKLVLIGGAGAPFALRPGDLAPLGPEAFGGVLPRHQVYLIGESHLDPRDGSRCFLETCTFRPGVRLWSVDSTGRGRGSRFVPLPHIYLPHDFGLTETKIIVPAGPIYANFPALLRATLGFGPMNDAFVWHGDEPTRYFIIDRRTWQVRTVQAPACYPVHVANAFDDGDDVVMDLNIHNGPAAVRGFTAALSYLWGEPNFRNRLYRVRLGANGRYSAQELVPFDCETPRSSEEREGRRSRYVYAAAIARGIAGGNRIVKVDAETSEVRAYEYPQRSVVSEPLFVPNEACGAEDDGWVLCQVYDSDHDLTSLSVLDAASFDHEVARVKLPFPLPYLLHGTYARAAPAPTRVPSPRPAQ